jgi:predicted transposase YbfD/YdcC
VHHFGFPHAAQVIQVTRKIRQPQTRRWRTVTVDAITSLSFAQASPARLADDLRGHWAIEHGLHYVRDVTFAEDAWKVRAGGGPHVMACLRNLAIGALSRAGNLAAALRHHARHPRRPLATLGITLGGAGRHQAPRRPGAGVGLRAGIAKRWWVCGGRRGCWPGGRSWRPVPRWRPHSSQ